jgi:hypothetical protein
MSLLALRGKRDIIGPKRVKRSASEECDSSPNEPKKPKIKQEPTNTPQNIESPLNVEVDSIRQLTILDQALRERKLQRFRSSVEARKLACTILGQTDMPFMFFSGLRIVDIVELAALTSMEMYAMIE